MGEKVIVRKKYQITIPATVRREFPANLEIGDVVDIEVNGNAIILKPQKVIDPDQAWFWTSEWQEGEKEAEDDIKSGRVESFNTVDDAVSWLDKIKESPVED